MFEVLISRLNTLTNALNAVDENQCGKILNGISKYLSKSLDAYFVDVFQRTKGKNVVFLKHVGSNREMPHDDSLTISIHSDEQRGVIPWVYNNKRDLWIHDHRDSDWEGSIVNQASVDGAGLRTGGKNNPDQQEEPDNKVYTDPRMHSFSEETAGFIAVPIIFKDIIEDVIMGVLSLEFKTSKVYDRRILEDFISISDLLALLFKKQEIDRHNDDTTVKAMNHFLDETSFEKVVPLAAEPTCFYVRPFKEDICKRAEDDAVKALKNVNVYHVNEIANEVNLNDIRQHIKKAHIGIVDVTGFTANVMCELGMMIMQGMNPLLIRNGDNEEDKIPYDIGHYTIHSYFERENSFFCDKVDGPDRVPLKKIVYDFAFENSIPPEYLINPETVETMYQADTTLPK
jgi:hypothetical protein